MEIARLTATTRGDVVAFVVRATNPLTLGRSSRCGVRLRDPKVSREHCCLTMFGEDLLVNDLDSAHGLLFRGERQATFRLKIGDGFHLGRTFVRFESLDDVDEATLASPSFGAGRAEPEAPAESGMGFGGGDEDDEDDANEPEDPPEVERATSATVPQLAQREGDLPPGTELGGFRIEAVIGRSDRTTVYRASQQHLHRAVALKVLRAGRNAREDAAARASFVADMRTAAARNDACLVAVFDVLDTPSFCAATVELVDGVSLADRLQRGPRPTWRELVPILADVLQGLQVVHQDRRVHGAVKPQNVFLLHKGGARLSDARATPLPRASEIDAMPSPEQRSGGIVDQRSDLYSLGAIAWLVLTGTMPPADPSTQALMRLDPSLPRAFAELIADRLLATNPAARPSTAPSVRNELTTFAKPEARRTPAPRERRDGDPVRQIPATPRPRGTPFQRFAARLTSEIVIVGMILLILIPTLVVLRVTGICDPIGWLSDALANSRK